MGLEERKPRQLQYATAPASLSETMRRPPAREFSVTRFVSVSEKKSVWRKMTNLLDNAKDTMARVRKGLEPVSMVSERDTFIPPEVVMGQYGGVLIAKKETS